MIALTSHLPSRGANGKKSDAINPRRVQASILIIVPQPIDTPQTTDPTPKPTDTMTGHLLEPITQGSTIRKNPVRELGSIPFPSPHIRKSCNAPDSANAPKSALGREPNSTNTYRKA